MRHAFFAFMLLSFIAGATFILPNIWNAAGLRLAASDPAALARIGLRSALTPASLSKELEASVNDGDTDLSASFLELAKQESLEIPRALREAHEGTTGTFNTMWRCLYEGFIKGNPKGAVQAGCASAGDLVLGDARDLVGEAAKYLRGENADEFVAALSAIGVLCTAGTYASAGSVGPLRAAVSMLKVMAKARLLQRQFLAGLMVRLKQVIDFEKLMDGLEHVSFSDIGRIQKAVQLALRLDKLEPLANLARDFVSLASSAAGLRGAQMALAVAHDTDEFHRALDLASERKGATAATLKVLGRDALKSPVSTSVLLSHVDFAIGYLVLGLHLVFQASILASAPRPLFGNDC